MMTTKPELEFLEHRDDGPPWEPITCDGIADFVLAVAEWRVQASLFFRPIENSNRFAHLFGSMPQGFDLTFVDGGQRFTLTSTGAPSLLDGRAAIPLIIKWVTSAPMSQELYLRSQE